MSDLDTSFEDSGKHSGTDERFVALQVVVAVAEQSAVGRFEEWR